MNNCIMMLVSKALWTRLEMVERQSHPIKLPPGLYDEKVKARLFGRIVRFLYGYRTTGPSLASPLVPSLVPRLGQNLTRVYTRGGDIHR